VLIYTRGVLNFSLLTCRAAIFESNVWRGMPSFVAAPECPETRPGFRPARLRDTFQHTVTYQFHFPAIPIFRKTPALCSHTASGFQSRLCVSCDRARGLVVSTELTRFRRTSFNRVNECDGDLRQLSEF
jgi:hypothetical protein